MRKTEKNKAALLKALEKNLGVVTYACASVGVTRKTFYNYYNSDPDFKQAVDDVQEVTLDFVEHKLLTTIKENNVTSIIFYLKTKGKDRGYVERQEIRSNTQLSFDPSSLSIEELKEVEKILKKPKDKHK